MQIFKNEDLNVGDENWDHEQKRLNENHCDANIKSLKKTRK